VFERAFKAVVIKAAAARLRRVGTSSAGLLFPFRCCLHNAFPALVAGVYWSSLSGRPLVPTAIFQSGARRRHQPLRMFTKLPADVAVVAADGEPGREPVDNHRPGGEECMAADVAALWEVLPGLRVFNRYGPTEATIEVTVYEVSRADVASGRIPLGVPNEGVSFTIVSDNGRILDGPDEWASFTSAVLSSCAATGGTTN